MNKKTLTSRQQKVFDFVNSFQQEHGFPPTLREIGEAVGLANTNAVKGHLDGLEKKGYITRTPDKARSIQIVYSPSRMSRVKQKVHKILRTDEGVLHKIVYGLAFATRGKERLLEGRPAEELKVVFDREATDRGWTIHRLTINPDHVVAVVETWPNHSPRRTVQRLQSAGESIRRFIPATLSKKTLWEKGYAATTDLELVDDLALELIGSIEKPEDQVQE